MPRECVEVWSRSPLAPSSSAGDVFVLDAGLSIYLWNGSGASHKEKAKGLEARPPPPPAPQRLARCLCLPLSPPPPLPAASQVALAIKDDERGGRAKLTACDQGACAARRGGRQHTPW